MFKAFLISRLFYSGEKCKFMPSSWVEIDAMTARKSRGTQTAFRLDKVRPWRTTLLSPFWGAPRILFLRDVLWPICTVRWLANEQVSALYFPNKSGSNSATPEGWNAWLPERKSLTWNLASSAHDSGHPSDMRPRQDTKKQVFPRGNQSLSGK